MDYNRIELEYAVVGALIADGREAGQYLAELRREDFEDVVCLGIFDAVRRLYNAGSPVDRITVSAELGEDYAEGVAEAYARRATDVGHYVRLLKQYALLEEARTYGLGISAAQSVEDISPQLDRLNALIVSKRGREAVTMGEAMQRFMTRHTGDAPKYLKFGLPELDDHLYCEPGDFVVIGGYPSAGKTVLATQFAMHLAKSRRVGFFSLETSPDKLTDRIVSHVTQIPMNRIKTNTLTDEQWRRAVDAAREISKLTCDQIPASGMTVADIQAFALSRRYEVVIIDYLQLVSDHTRGSRYEAVTNVSLALHTMSQTTGITVIALAQLSRPDKTEKKPRPPTMASFRESGQIEQDADVALLLYQEDQNDYRSRRVLKIGKNKEGERTTLLLDFRGETQTFSPAKPTPGETYRNVRKACAQAAKTGRKENQVTFEEIDSAEPLPF